jgi:hypothetical protein
LGDRHGRSDRLLERSIELRRVDDRLVALVQPAQQIDVRGGIERVTEEASDLNRTTVPTTAFSAGAADPDALVDGAGDDVADGAAAGSGDEGCGVELQPASTAVNARAPARAAMREFMGLLPAAAPQGSIRLNGRCSRRRQGVRLRG